MPKNSRRNRMMPPVAHSAAANQGTATLAKTADLEAALKSVKTINACPGTFFRQWTFALTQT
jgi:hypothetical protein